MIEARQTKVAPIGYTNIEDENALERINPTKTLFYSKSHADVAIITSTRFLVSLRRARLAGNDHPR